MNVSLEPWSRTDGEALVAFLTDEDWPFHAGGRPSPQDVRDRLERGHYDGPTTRTFWVLADGERAGLLRLEDLGDDTPMFDLRLSTPFRGRGIGTRAVQQLTNEVFTGFPHVHRIEATTRQDNIAMRRALRRAGYAKEAHYRDAWPARDGGHHDSVGYAVLRRDWATGTVTPPDWHDEPA